LARRVNCSASTSSPRSAFACVRSWSVAACVISVLCASVSLSDPAEVGRVRRPEVTPPTSLGASAVQVGSSFSPFASPSNGSSAAGCDPRTSLRSVVHGDDRSKHQLRRSSAKRYRSCHPVIPSSLLGQSLCDTLRRCHLIQLITRRNRSDSGM
jgi:hypothetical protein